MDDKTKRIEDLIRIYGADMDRWPAAEGLGRPQLDARLKAVLAEEKTLDDLIAHTAVPAPSAALRARILAIPGTISGAGAAPRPARGFSWVLTGFWRPAGIAACALILGLFLGQLTLMQTAQVTQLTAVDSETETLFADLVLGPADGLAEFTQ